MRRAYFISRVKQSGVTKLSVSDRQLGLIKDLWELDGDACMSYDLQLSR